MPNELEDLAREEFEEDFGFSTLDRIEVKDTSELEARLLELEATNKTLVDRLEATKKMILPLLHNLMRDPNKDIHWPDRDKKIKDFERKLLATISGEPIKETKKVRRKVNEQP